MLHDSQFGSLPLASAAAASAIWPSQSYVTEDFKPPNVRVKQNGRTAPGYLFLSPNGNGTTDPSPVIFTNDNELVWNGPGDGWTYTDFHVQTLNNKPHLTYIRGNATATFGHGYGAVYILDSSYRQVHKICPDGLDIVTPEDVVYECYLDQHEGLITSDNTMLATAYNVTGADLTSVGGPKDGWIFDSIFFEIDIATGKVIFRWRSLDYPDRIPITESKYSIHQKTITYGLNSSEPWDYFHINSVQKVSDGYLVNSRHLFSTYKVFLNGSVEWGLSAYGGGDFAAAPDMYFSWQHKPRILPSSSKSLMQISYFNNDNSEVQNGTNSTTGILLDLHLNTRTVTLGRKLVFPSQPIFADSQGSYQALPGDHVLIGYGQIAKTREFDPNNRLIYEATYGYSNASSMCASYRSYRNEWHAESATPPKVAVKDGKVHVSWNGATEVASWRLYAGKNCSHLSAAGKAQKRTGFESAYGISHIPKGHLVVEALDKSGRRLRNSSCISVS